jgi:ABC-2 type transport system permease protein
MNIKHIITVIKRELRDKLYSKTFIFMTLLIPGLMILSIGVQSLFLSIDGDEGTRIQIISESSKIGDKVKAKLEELPFIKSGYYKVSFYQKNKDEFKKYYSEIQKQLLEDSRLGLIFIPDSVLVDKQVKFYSKNPINNPLFMKLKGPLNEVFVELYFEGKQLTKEEIDFARLSVDFTGLRVTEEETAKKEGVGNLIVSFVFTFLLYISLLVLGQLMMRAVVEEKNNRIVEVILSSINSKELMVGKILGSTITGLVQMGIWLTPVILLITTTWFALPEEFTLNLNGWQIFYFLLNYLMGLLTYLSLFATVGAIFDNDQDAQSGIWPITLLIMIPFFISLSLTNNPNNPVGTIASIVPFASIIVMPARFTLIDVPLWQFVLSIILDIAVIAAIFPLAGKIYKIGILLTGKKPSWKEVFGWLRTE